MFKHTIHARQSRWAGILAVLLMAILAGACSAGGQANSSPQPDLTLTSIFREALLTATYAVADGDPTATASPPPTLTPEASPTPSPSPAPFAGTPPPLPEVFRPSALNQNDKPYAYIEDTCQYLKMKWHPDNAEPGTIVMPIMFHSITDGEVTDANQISRGLFIQLLEDLKNQGFETITAEQLADFMESNAKIPKRSVILILDDRRPGAVKEHFLPMLEKFDWTLTLGWIVGAGDDSTDKKPASQLKSAPEETYTTLWEQIKAYYASGRLDVQAHGYVHNIPISNGSSEEFIHDELFIPITVLESHFGKRPIAFIWPGGGFTRRAAEVARQAGYRLAFTVNPRGPLMYNWVPLSDAIDPMRPSYMPEGAIGDPLMVLPRYWDTDAVWRIDEARLMGKEAEAYALENKQAELDYYNLVCRSRTGEIPGLIP